MTPADIVKFVKQAAVAAGYTAKGRIFFKRGNELATIVGCYKLSHFDRVRVTLGVYPTELLLDDPKLKLEVYPLKLSASEVKAPFGKVFWELGAAKDGEPGVTAIKVQSACATLFEWLASHLEDEPKLKKAITKDEAWISDAWHDCEAIRDWAAGKFVAKNYKDWIR